MKPITTVEVKKPTLERLRQAGRKSQSYDKLIAERISCNTTGCQNDGIIKLVVNTGKFGNVTLFVCRLCVGKFVES